MPSAERGAHEPLGLRERLAYGLGDFGSGLYWQTFTIYLTFFVRTSSALGLAPRIADACSYAIPPPVELDPALAGVDITPPLLTAVRLSGLERGIPGTAGGCLTHSTFWLEADASDDLTRPEELAYRVEALRGDPPLYYEDEPMAYMYFVWEEEPTEPLDFELRVRAVDEAGNESEPIDIRVTDGSGTSEGCSLSRGSDGALPACVPMLAATSGCLRRWRRGRQLALGPNSGKL